MDRFSPLQPMRKQVQDQVVQDKGNETRAMTPEMETQEGLNKEECLGI